VEANLNYFLECALEMDSGRYPSLSHFLASLESASDNDTASPPDPSWNRQPRIRVMTIHAAKGLEAPVVFLADAARDTGNRERGLRTLIDWPINDARPRYFHLAGKKDTCDDISAALLKEQQWSARREEANLLYVALTRARQVLYISGCESGKGGRGWYGFIEKRLRRAAHLGTAADIGLVLQDIPANDAATGVVFNTCGRLEYGHAPAATPEMPPHSIAAFTLDAALTIPLTPTNDAGVLNPSRERSVGNIHPDDSETGLDRNGRRRGIVIHRMLECLTQNATRTVIEKQLRQEFVDWPTATEFTAWWHEASEVIDSPALREYFDPGHYREARNEVPLLYREDGRDVYGVIDRLIIRDDDVVLIDYKTHAHVTPDNMASLAREFSEQMRWYGIGARRLWPAKKLRLLLIFTACNRFVELPVS
jgi:ATP-dependent helicase/nuclease subunit A